MNRIIAIAGVFALLAAAIPALYQNDPRAFETALRSLTGITGPAQPPQPFCPPPPHGRPRRRRSAGPCGWKATDAAISPVSSG
jgi:hypothetical protein